MADNVDITPGTGKTIATDDCGAAGHTQRIKLSYSADGDATPVAADVNGLHVLATITDNGYTGASISTQNLNPVSGVPTASSTVTVPCNGQSTLGIQVYGTYTGALSVQGTTDNFTWLAIGAIQSLASGVLSSTIPSGATGNYVANCAGFASIRVSALAAVTGSAGVIIKQSPGVALVGLNAPLPGVSTVARGPDASPAGTYLFNNVSSNSTSSALPIAGCASVLIQVVNPDSATVTIEVSVDGFAWTALPIARIYSITNVPIGYVPNILVGTNASGLYRVPTSGFKFLHAAITNVAAGGISVIAWPTIDAPMPQQMAKVADMWPPGMVMQNAATATGNGATLDVRGYASALLVATGSWGGTVQVEASVDDTTWTALDFTALVNGAPDYVGFFQGIGYYRVAVHGYKSLRARISTYTSGNITVTGYLGNTPSDYTNVWVRYMPTTPVIGPAKADTATVNTLTNFPIVNGGRASAAIPTDVGADARLVYAWYLRNGSASVTQTDTIASGNITTQNLNPVSGVATAASTVATVALNGVSVVAIQVTGTYTGALTPQGSVDGSNWVALAAIQNIGTGALAATIASATVGIFAAGVGGFSLFRVTALGAMTGTATVSLRTSAAEALSAIDAPLPAGTNNIGVVTQAALTKGTQGSAGVSTQDLKDAGRTSVRYYATGVAAGATGVETIITLTQSKGTAATSTGTSFVPTAGKTFRIQYIVFTSRGNATAVAQVTTHSLRINTAGAAIVTSTPLVLQARTATPATSSAWDRVQIDIPDGYEIPGDGTLAFCVTMNAVYVTSAPTWDVLIVGYEY